METQMTLTEMIDQQRTKPVTPAPVSIHFAWDSLPKVKKLNLALREMNGDDRLAFMRRLLYVWNGGHSAEPEARKNENELEELRKILGPEKENHFGHWLVFTLSGDGKQFRCWYGQPGVIRHEHVDSCGQGLLFHVYGDRNDIALFINDLLPEYMRNCALHTPRGGVIYGFFW